MLGIEGLTGTLFFAILVAACGSAFQHGYNSGVVNAPQKVIEKWIGGIMAPSGNSTALKSQVTVVYSVMVSVYCLGGMIGGVLTNFWANTFGMKFGIMMNNIFIFFAAALMGFSRSQSSYIMLIAGRFMAGMNSGLNGGLVPMYLSEIPPKNLRGGVGSVYQLCLTISILISQILSSRQVLGNESNWQWLFFIIAIPALFQVLLLPLCADSPRYLANMKRDEDAKKALQWFRGLDDVQTEVAVLKSETEEDSKLPSPSIHDLFTIPVLRKPLIIACVVMLAQQFSGINAVIYYSTSSFRHAKLSDSTAELGTILMGVMNVAMTVLSTLIVDKAGRKTLLAVGFGLMFIDTIFLCICLTLAIDYNNVVASYISIVLVILFVVFFATGPGSIPWFLVSELFLPNARPLAISFAVPTNWIANSLVGFTFPIVQELLHSYVFIIFAALQMFFLIYTLTSVPETKNRDITDIHALFVPKK